MSEGINPAFLTAEERALFDAWQEMFSSAGFRLLRERAAGDYAEAADLYDKISNDVGFARVQGYRNAIKTLVLNLPDIVYNEYAALVNDRMERAADAQDEGDGDR